MSDTSEMFFPEPIDGLGELGFGEEPGLDEIPSMETLDADLDAAATAGGFADLAGGELTAEEELAFAEFETSTTPALDELVSLLQRYPGLKVSLSF